MAAFRDFDRYILPFMTNPPLFAVDDALRDAAIEFCDRARVITEVGDLISVTANSAELDIDSPDATLVSAGVVNVYSSEGKLTPKTKRELDELYPSGWMFETADALNKIPYWIALNRETVRLVPYPVFTQANAFSLEVAFKPARDASSLPDVLYQHYAEAIAAGAMARLHSHPTASYANVARIEGYAIAFENFIVKVADEHVRGVGKPQMRTGQDEFQ